MLVFCGVAHSQSSRDSIILNWYIQGKITKDSLLHKLYDIGRLDYPLYLSELSKERRKEEESKALQVLRNESHYKFVLEYLLCQKYDSTQYDTLALQKRFPCIIKPYDSLACEAYEIEWLYFLYKCSSYDGRTKHYILEEYYGWGAFTLYLFNSDTTYPSIVDSIQVDQNAELSFHSYKEHNVVKIKYSDSRKEEIVAIDKNRFMYIGRPNQALKLTGKARVQKSAR